MCDGGGASLFRFRQVSDDGTLSDHLGADIAVRAAAPGAVAVSGVRRASEVPGLPTSDVEVDTDADVADLQVMCQKNDHFGLGQLPHLLAIKSWGEVCPARLLSGWPWLCPRVGARRDHLDRMSSATNALFAGLSHAKVGSAGRPWASLLRGQNRWLGARDAWRVGPRVFHSER